MLLRLWKELCLWLAGGSNKVVVIGRLGRGFFVVFFCKWTIGTFVTHFTRPITHFQARNLKKKIMTIRRITHCRVHNTNADMAEGGWGALLMDLC